MHLHLVDKLNISLPLHISTVCLMVAEQADRAITQKTLYFIRFCEHTTKHAAYNIQQPPIKAWLLTAQKPPNFLFICPGKACAINLPTACSESFKIWEYKCPKD